MTLNVQSGASVVGTSIGINVNNNNTINNLGTITTHGTGGIGDVWGITANGPLTVNNSGTIGRADIANNIFDAAGIFVPSTLTVTNNAGGVIQGTFGVQGATVGTVVNSRLINAIGGGGAGIDFSANAGSSVSVTNNASGTITGDSFGINASIATVANYGTISAPSSGGIAVNANTLTLTNYASGVITGDGGAISGSQTPNLTVTNFGTISGGINAASGAIFGNVVNVTNSGTISVAAGSGGSAIQMSSGSVVNNAGGLITGDFDTIAAGGGTSVFNAGTISVAGVGGTAILFGLSGGNTLTLGPGSVINGKVQGFGADTFQLGGVGSDTFNLSLIGTQYTGFATFNKIGTSVWTVTGTFGQTDPWTVNAGTLVVNGNLSSATTLTVTGGTLGGTGTVGNTLINSGGTLAPGGAANPTGTLTIAGNLAFQSAAFYLVTVAGGNASNANLSGTAALGGTVQVAFASAASSKTYGILHSAGLGGTTFSGATSLNPNYAASLSYTATDVFLNLTATLGAGAPLNGNQQNVSSVINNFVNSGGTLPAGLLSIFGLSGGSLTNALSQLDGEAATGAERGAFQLMDEFLALMLDPLSYGRGGGGGGGQAIGFAPDEQAGLPPDIALAYASILKAPPKPSFDQRWTAWGAAYGGSNTANGDAVVGSNNVTARTFGFAGGMDYHITPNTVLGFALAGGGTNWNLSGGLGGGRSDAFQGGVYGITRAGPAYLSGALAFANHWFTTNRSAVGDQLTASFDGQSYGARLEGGYRYAVLPTFGATPYAALQAQDFHTPRYSETDLTGGGFGLTYASMNATDVRTELGARFDVPTLLYNMPLILRGRAAWAHDFVNNPSLGAVFQTLPGSNFIVNGAPIPRDSALTSAGAELFLAANWTLLAKFEGEFAKGPQTYAGSGTVRYAW